MSVWIRFSATKERYDQNVYEFRVLEFGNEIVKACKINNFDESSHH